MLTRNLSLRETLPPSALAAGYSVMYAAVGAGYAATGSLAGVLLKVAAPSTAILAGVGLTLLLTFGGAMGEGRRARVTGVAEGSAVGLPGETGAQKVAVDLRDPGRAARPEGAPVCGGGDAERCL